MRASTRFALASAVVLACAACGREASTPTASSPTTSGTLATRARWVFSRPESGLNAKLDLDGGQTLYVGQHGRRALSKGDDVLVDAPTLARTHLVGVLREGSDFAFVGDDGDVFVAHEPLGALEAPRKGPLGEGSDGGVTFASIATGRAAILAITFDGRVLRSVDFGRHWAEVDYTASSKVFGHPFSVALDTKGNGLLVALPQRAYVTHDDGASWGPIATPGIGANAVHRDGADQVLLQGPAEQAKLDGAELHVYHGPLQPLHRAPRRTPGSPPAEPPARALLLGDTVVELSLHAGLPPTVEVSSRKLGEATREAGTASAELVSAHTGRGAGEAGVSPYVGGRGRTLVYARADAAKDATGAVTTTILRSLDLGATWKSEATFPGHFIERGTGAPVEGLTDRDVAGVEVGPGDWTFVRAMCPPGTTTETKDVCTRRQIRPAGATGYQDVVSDEEFMPLQFAFDEAHGKVYALGKHDRHVGLYESPLAGNHFTRMNLLAHEVDNASAATTAITVDDAGTLRVLDHDAGQLRLLRHGSDGKDSPVLYAPVPHGEMATAGLRGLVSGNRGTWETADGGETWARVAVSGGHLSCAAAGCILGVADRVGWDLPAFHSDENVAATAEPKPIVDDKPPPRPPAKPPVVTPPPLEITCKPSGVAGSVPSTPIADSLAVYPTDVRWSELEEDKDHKLSIFVGGRAAVRELSLLGPEPAPTAVQHKTSVFRGPDAFVAVRAAWTPRAGDAPPVDVSLAWWSARTGRVSRHALPGTKLNVARSPSLGEARVVDGGVLYQAGENEPVHFLWDDGVKDETVTFPRGTALASVVRVGDHWVIPVLTSGSARLSFSDAATGKWTTKTWRLDEGSVMSIVKLGGKPHIGLHVSVGRLPTMYTVILVPLDSITDDPPTPVTVPPGPANATCDAAESTYHPASQLTPGSQQVHVKIDGVEGATRFTGNAIARPTLAGAYCAAAYVGDASGEAVVFREPQRYTGVLFQRKVDPKDPSHVGFMAKPLACAHEERP